MQGNARARRKSRTSTASNIAASSIATENGSGVRAIAIARAAPDTPHTRGAANPSSALEDSAAPIVRVIPRPTRHPKAERVALVVRLSPRMRPSTHIPTQIPAAEAITVTPAEDVGHTVAPGTVVSTAGGAALMGVGMIIAGALGYIQTVTMTHMVSRSTFGIFVVVFTATTFLSQFTKLGFGGVLIRFLPAYRATGNYHLAAGLARFALWVPTALSAICALALFFLAHPIAQDFFHSDMYAVALREAAVLIPLNAMQSIILSSLQAIKNVRWQVYVGRIIEPAGTLVMVVVFFLLGFRLEALIFAYIVGIGLSVAAGYIAFRREAGSLIRAKPQYETGTWSRFGAAMLFNSLSIAVIQSTDVLGLGAFASASQVSLYRVADRIGGLIAMPFFALNIIFSPMISEYHTRGDHAQLGRMYALVTRWSLAVSLPIGLCSIVFAGPILGVFGKGYSGGAAALIVLATGSIINAGTGPVNNMLVMASRLRVLWINTGIWLGTNVILIFALVPPYGLIGAAVASSLTVVIVNLVALGEVWWIMKLQPYHWAMLKPLIAGAVAVPVGLLLLHLTHAGSPHASSLKDFIAALGLVLAFVAVYAAVLWRLGLTAEDRQVFVAIRAKFTRSKRVKSTQPAS